MSIISVVLSVGILVSLFKASTKNEIPQSPAACGTAFFIATAGIASWQHLLTIIPSYSLFLAASVISLPALSISSGYIAARTSEDTASMNAKIVAGVAFIPYLIISYFSLMSAPSWANYYAAIIFIPCILVGFKINQMHNKSSKQDAENLDAPS